MSGPSARSPLAFLHVLQRLKLTKRTGWLNHAVRDPESIADHMYRMATIAMIVPDDEVDTRRCLELALVHDMAEAIVGDITPLDGISKAEKHDREQAAIETMTELLEPMPVAQRIRELFDEYETGTTPEAVMVKDIDKYELLVQTLEYERSEQKRFDGFWSVYDGLRTPTIRAWADDVLAQRDALHRREDERRL